MVTAQEAVQAVLDEQVAVGREGGLQASVWFDGEQVVDAWAGMADRETGKPFDGRTLTTVFSVTKGIASIAVHLLAERGQIDYDQPYAMYVPEFGVDGKEFVTVAQTMSHQAGIPQVPASVTPETVGDWEASLEATLTQPPLWEPGKAVGYHSLTHGWITGGLVQAVDGRRIDRFIYDELLTPLGLHEDFFLGLPASAEDRVSSLRMHPSLQAEPEPEPESYAALATPPWWYPLGEKMNLPEVRRAVVPGAGAMTTASALARIYAAAIGEVNGFRFFPESRVNAMSALQTDEMDLVLQKADPKGIGFFLGAPESPMSERRSAFGHPGYGGSIAFADPDYGFTFALTKNTLLSEPDKPAALAAARAARQALGIPER